MTLEQPRGSQDSLDPIKMYSQSVQDIDDAGKIQAIDGGRKNNDRTHLEKKKDF